LTEAESKTNTPQKVQDMEKCIQQNEVLSIVKEESEALEISSV
jgi:hypothetical protein